MENLTEVQKVSCQTYSWVRGDDVVLFFQIEAADGTLVDLSGYDIVFTFGDNKITGQLDQDNKKVMFHISHDENQIAYPDGIMSDIQCTKDDIIWTPWVGSAVVLEDVNKS